MLGDTGYNLNEDIGPAILTRPHCCIDPRFPVIEPGKSCLGRPLLIMTWPPLMKRAGIGVFEVGTLLNLLIYASLETARGIIPIDFQPALLWHRLWVRSL